METLLARYDQAVQLVERQQEKMSQAVIHQKLKEDETTEILKEAKTMMLEMAEAQRAAFQNALEASNTTAAESLKKHNRIFGQQNLRNVDKTTARGKIKKMRRRNPSRSFWLP